MLNLRKVSKIVNSGRKNAGYALVFAETLAHSRFKLSDAVFNDQTVEEDGSITIRLTAYDPGDNGKDATRRTRSSRVRVAANV